MGCESEERTAGVGAGLMGGRGSMLWLVGIRDKVNAFIEPATSGSRIYVPAAFLRRSIAGLVALAVATAPTLQQASAAVTLTRAEYEACQAEDEQAFRSAVESITLKALQSGLHQVDFRSLVAAEWRRIGFDEIVDKQVDAAVNEVHEESTWGDLLQSLAYKEKAQELATAVAERVFQSQPVKSGIEQLATGVGKEIGRNIELATVDAAEPSLQCLQAYLGPRFGLTVSRVVASDAGKAFAIDPGSATAQVSTTSVLVQGSEGIAGAVILLVRRQLSNMAARIGHRLVGAVLGRLVSIVAGGIGVVLIAKDIWELRSGVLPIIAEEMKSQSTKERVQEELAKSISDQLDEQVRDLSAKTADRIVEIWREFRRSHAKVLELAEKSAPFKAYLDAAHPNQLPRIDELVGLIAGKEGDEGVLKRLDNGTLPRAVNTLSEPGMTIARETRSVDDALLWTTMAGDRIGLVIDYEIHRRAKADDFTTVSLGRILALDDRLAAARLAGIERSARDVLFELDDGQLRSLARGLNETELSALARYLSGLQPSASQRVLRAVAQTPAKMEALGSARVRDAILASRDQDAAVAMMLRTNALPSPVLVASDFQLVLDGQVSPVLLWERHSIILSVLACAALVVLLYFKRLLFGRRRKAVA